MNFFFLREKSQSYGLKFTIKEKAKWEKIKHNYPLMKEHRNNRSGENVL